MARGRRRKDAPVRAHDQLIEAVRAELEKADADSISLSKMRDELLKKLPPSLFNSWLDEQLPTLLYQVVREEVNHIRGSMRARARSMVYGSEVTGIPIGADLEDFSIFKVRYRMGNGDSTAVALGALRGADHLAIAEDYDKRGNRSLLRAALHRELARKCGTKRTDEVLTEEELIKLFGSHEIDPFAEAVVDREVA